MKTTFVALFASLIATAFWTIPATAGEIFVTSFTYNIIDEYTTSGGTVNAPLVSNVGYPYAIAASGTDLFTANGNDTIGEYTTAGTTVNAALVSGLSSAPEGIAVSGGDLFLATPALNTISEYSATTGATINASLITGLSYPVSAIAVSGGDLFVLNGNAISEYTTSGATVNASLVTGLYDEPNALAVSGGDLFVTNNTTGTIGEYTTSGATVNAALVTLGGPDEPPGNPVGIAVSGSDLFVATYAVAGNYGAIEEYTTSGAMVDTFQRAVYGPPDGIVVVTPEPSTWIMLVIGAAALLVCGMRKERASKSEPAPDYEQEQGGRQRLT